MRRFKHSPVVFTFCLLVSCLLSMSVGAADPTEDTAVDQHGNVHDWHPQPGAVTIVDFAASWCGPCRDSLPKLQAYADGHPEVRVLVISVDETVDGRDRLVESLGLRVPVLWDEGHHAAEFYRPTGMPSTFVYDARGEAVLSYAGSAEKDWQRLKREVDALTSGPR